MGIDNNEIAVVIPESGDEDEEDGAGGVTAMFTELAAGLKQEADNQRAAATLASTQLTQAADNQLAMSNLVNNLAGAFTRKFGRLVANVNEVLGALNTNVHDKVRTVQEDAHDKRGAIVGHVNQTGGEVQEAINGLQQEGLVLNLKREQDEKKREEDIIQREKDREAKDNAVRETLDQHDNQLADHKNILNRHAHQLPLVKNALDEDLKYTNARWIGTSMDKLIDWDCDLNGAGEVVRGDDGIPTGRRQPSRRLAANSASVSPSEQVLRRRLANQPKTHLRVLEALLEDIQTLH